MFQFTTENDIQLTSS